MAARFLNKYTVLVTLQKRLDSGAVTLYEAVLGMLALQRLFHIAGQTETLSDVDQLWAMHVYEQLRAITEGRAADSDEDDNEAWMDVWLTHSGTNLLVAYQASAELLASVQGGDQRGIREVASPRKTTGGAEENAG